VLFYVLFVCKCVLYYCHRVSTQLHLTNISICRSYETFCVKSVILTFFFQFHDSVHHKSMSKISTLMQQFKCLFHLSSCSTCFGRCIHPSSGASTCGTQLRFNIPTTTIVIRYWQERHIVNTPVSDRLSLLKNPL